MSSLLIGWNAKYTRRTMPTPLFYLACWWLSETYCRLFVLFLSHKKDIHLIWFLVMLWRPSSVFSFRCKDVACQRLKWKSDTLTRSTSYSALTANDILEERETLRGTNVDVYGERVRFSGASIDCGEILNEGMCEQGSEHMSMLSTGDHCDCEVDCTLLSHLHDSLQ